MMLKSNQLWLFYPCSILPVNPQSIPQLLTSTLKTMWHLDSCGKSDRRYEELYDSPDSNVASQQQLGREMHWVLSQWVTFLLMWKKYKIQKFLIIFKVENAGSLEKILPICYKKHFFIYFWILTHCAMDATPADHSVMLKSYNFSLDSSYVISISKWWFSECLWLQARICRQIGNYLNISYQSKNL